MYCTSCGGALETGWAHCPKCGEPFKVAEDKAIDGDHEHNYSSQKEVMNLFTFDAWRAANTPPLIFTDAVVTGFNFTAQDQLDEYERFGRFFLNNAKSFNGWKSKGMPLTLGGSTRSDVESQNSGWRSLSSAIARKEIQKRYPDDRFAEIWQKSGEPKVWIVDEEIAFIDKYEEFKFYRGSMSGDDFDRLFDTGFPELSRFIANGNGKTKSTSKKGAKSDETEVSYTQAEKELDERWFKAYLAAGSPQLVRRKGKIEPLNALSAEEKRAFTLAYLPPLAAEIWQAAGEPDLDAFADSLESHLSEMSEQGPQVEQITSDAEFKRWATRDQFKVWKQRGRPTAVVVDGEYACYQIQLTFEKVRGVQMSGDMVDLWYWAGCPPIETWDYQLSLSQHHETTMAALGFIQQQQSNWGSIFSGIGEALGQVAQAAGQGSSQRSGPKSTIIWGLGGVGRCSRCGSEVSGSVCRYCQ